MGTTDVIISYVNGSDKAWVNSYIKATNTHNPATVRYRSWGTLKYLLRGIDQYMPFVRNVILIVAMPSQVPIWLNTSTVRVVYHSDYIPRQFLPTFNSCTIESYLWNIPDLADQIIYFNDDMFPIGDMIEDDFFTGNMPNIRFIGAESYSVHNIFRNQCRSGMDLITEVLQLPKFEQGKIIRPAHIPTALTKYSLNAVAELCKDLLPTTISKTRLTKNVNQYIYAYYHYFTNSYTNGGVDYEYYEITEKTISQITKDISDSEHKMICINDSDKIKDFVKVRNLLTSAFANKFPRSCKYEM